MIDFSQKQIIDDVLKTLTDRERIVIELRTGYRNGYKYTLKEIADALNISPERVRQLHIKAMEKLNHKSRHDKLKIVYKEILQEIDI